MRVMGMMVRTEQRNFPYFSKMRRLLVEVHRKNDHGNRLRHSQSCLVTKHEGTKCAKSLFASLSCRYLQHFNPSHFTRCESEHTACLFCKGRCKRGCRDKHFFLTLSSHTQHTVASAKTWHLSRFKTLHEVAIKS